MESERKELANELDALFRQIEEHKKDPEYRNALEETHRYLLHKEGRRLILAHP
ncbi:hypothetical protein HYU17_03380 [Candidatus Woesearchaeota archaeon]|nr:hypothetical protein [Candidatus Woesearchaeota archaeon]